MPLDQAPPPMPTFQLASMEAAPPQSLMVLEDGLTLLRAMEFGLKQLQGLVRRRGHTNDPTQEIAQLVQQLEQDTRELTDFCQQLLRQRRSSKQDKRHWELVVEWFQQVANHFSTQLQKCLKVRGEVLADQAQQRKKLMVDKNNKHPNRPRSTLPSARSAAAATPLFDSPLFSAQHQALSSNGKASTLHTHNDATSSNGISSNNTLSQSTKNTTDPNPYARGSTSASSSNGYGQGYGGGGYGGYYGGYGSTSSSIGATGMRQRKGESVPSNTTQTIDYTQEEEEKVHQQIQQRQNKRQTQQRLDEARQAETKLGELGQLFGKMSSLISQQGEVMEKIEDDVESARAEVVAGQEELTTLYSLKKGNRPLIIKVFLILDFLIIFMRAYKK